MGLRVRPFLVWASGYAWFGVQGVGLTRSCLRSGLKFEDFAHEVMTSAPRDPPVCRGSHGRHRARRARLGVRGLGRPSTQP